MRSFNYSNPELPLYDTLPAKGIEVGLDGFIKDLSQIKKDAKHLDKDNFFYYCGECKGFIQGQPDQQGENDIGPLCGRRGTSYNCIRCGWEIGFSGVVS